jgi:hypothetical protein
VLPQVCGLNKKKQSWESVFEEFRVYKTVQLGFIGGSAMIGLLSEVQVPGVGPTLSQLNVAPRTVPRTS